MQENPTGVIFDLQRFCTHDGPGIRSVLFLKGCPLHCLWCHNPESVSIEPQLRYNPQLCIDCKKCFDIIGTSHDPRANYNDILADGSGKNKQLAEVCPVGAWELIGKSVTVAEIMSELEADRVYYDSSGGGVTLSGGEAMLQYDFTLALAKQLKEAGINTAIETAGASSEEKYRAVAEYIDLFLWDYKLTDPELHKKYVGGSLENQLHNLKCVLETSKVALRCVYLNKIHDQQHWQRLAELYHSSDNIVGVRILPYHNLAQDKYAHLGLDYPLELAGQEPIEEEILKINSYLKAQGVVITQY